MHTAGIESQLVNAERYEVSYFDRDWNEDDELRLTASSIIEVDTAVESWLYYRLQVMMGIASPTHPLARIEMVAIEVVRRDHE
jgi:hypothetical protein